MSDVITDAVLIIRCLYDAGAVSAGSVDFKGRELIKLTGLSESEVNAADTYLLQAGFVEGTNGLDGSHKLLHGRSSMMSLLYALLNGQILHSLGAGLLSPSSIGKAQFSPAFSVSTRSQYRSVC